MIHKRFIEKSFLKYNTKVAAKALAVAPQKFWNVHWILRKKFLLPILAAPSDLGQIDCLKLFEIDIY